MGLAGLIFSSGKSQNIILPEPQTTGGMPLMEALSKRQTSREFSETKLSDQVVSNLLWAAWGYNRPDQKKRTAPSSMNKQEIDVYVAMQSGLYLYNAEKHLLELIHSEDIRAKTGKQDFVAKAPLTLIFVADYNRMSSGDDQQKDVTSNTDAAFISQNVYLYCASENLATGVRAYVDKEELHKAMRLQPEQHVTLAQSVGQFNK
jgi:SagB-type dehydrogenase family enzyme